MVAIHPEILKTLRKRAGLSQQALADTTQGRNKVGIATIKRIETVEGTYETRPRIAEGLAQALGVSVQDLSEEPRDVRAAERTLRSWGYRRIKALLDSKTALAFDMVERLYGISPQQQIDMAPLFTALLAEGSLTWRREQLGVIDEAVEKLDTVGSSSGHLHFAYAAGTENGSRVERKSIEKRDLFGLYLLENGWQLSFPGDEEVNPIAAYLRHFAQKVGAKEVAIEEEAVDGAFPNYWIAEDEIEAITGGSNLARHAMSRGHARIKDIPEDLLGEDRKDDRIAWMVSRIPEKERGDVEALRKKLNIDLSETADPALSPESR